MIVLAVILLFLWASMARAATLQARRQAAVEYALAQVGEPYVFGAAGPDSWDCSGLTMMALRRAGVRLAHWTRSQIRRGFRVPKALPGDLVFFGPGHVGLFVGDGRVVVAPHAGARVRVERVVWSRVSEVRRVIQ